MDVEVKHDYPNSQPRAGITPAEERKRLEEEVQGFYNALKCDFATVHVEVSEFFFKPERPIDIGSKIGVDELTVPSERFVEPEDLADLPGYFQDYFKADNEQGIKAEHISEDQLAEIPQSEHVDPGPSGSIRRANTMPW